MARIRKRNPSARNQSITVRMNDYELELVDKLSSKLDIPKTNVIRCALAYFALHFDTVGNEEVNNVSQGFPPGVRLEPEYIKHPDGSITFTGFGLVRDEHFEENKHEEESED